MQFAYMKLLQHVYDVPTINDGGDMQYTALEDASNVRMNLQNDMVVIQLLIDSGQHVLWLDEDALNRQIYELPALFHEMGHFYTYIDKKLKETEFANEDAAQNALEIDREESPDTQSMPDDDESPHGHRRRGDGQRAQMYSLLRQLQQINST
jgi:hypothetical protein